MPTTSLARKRFTKISLGGASIRGGHLDFSKSKKPGTQNVIAALQGRRALLEGVKTVGFECTVAVDDVRTAIATALEFGGRSIIEPVMIPTVCELAFLEDPAGNVFGIARYERTAT